MTVGFRVLIVLSALAGLAAAHAPRATADDGGMTKCWYRPGIDPPEACTFCEDPCPGGTVPCCLGDIAG